MNAPAPVGGTAAGRFLVVDDLEANRDLLARRLRRAGHHVDTVASGDEALEALRATPYDIVLLDVMMPGRSGYETLAELKADPVTQSARVIMVSAVDEVDSIAHCIELGADDYLTKPVDPILLSARVASSLARRRVAEDRRLHAEALEHELEIGRHIQAGFFPPSLPDVNGWRLATRFVSARQVAGDFYDVFRLPTGHLGLVVADVCDKGVGAALYMALFRTLIRSRATTATTRSTSELLVETIAATNDYIAVTHAASSMFATVLLAALDPDDGRLTYVNAGHEPGYVRRADGGVERLEPTGPAVGLLPGLRSEAADARLAPGELLLATTDGVSEAFGPHGTLFGDEGVTALLSTDAEDPEHLVDTLMTSVADHRGTAEVNDDVTVLAVARDA